VADLVTAGFSRGWDGAEIDLAACLAEDPEALMGDAALVMDRIQPASTELQRLSESIELGYGLGDDRVRFLPRAAGPEIILTRHATCPEHGRALADDLSPRHFSFNSHWGACEGCSGLGRRTQIDPDLVLPHPKKALGQALDARIASIVLRSARNRALIGAVFGHFGIAPEVPVSAWPTPLRQAMLHGLPEPLEIAFSRSWGRTVTAFEEIRLWKGIIGIMAGWKGKGRWQREASTCSACGGGRLRPPLLAVTLQGHNIAAATAMTVHEALAFWRSQEWSPHEAPIAEQPVRDLTGKLHFLAEVGVGYLTLDRAAETLSGGESQRIRLATQLGSRLTGTIYVLDEPTIGLHPRDTARLLDTLRSLRDLGNSVVLVEHDAAVIRAADHVIDMGPAAGEHGGRVVATGTPAQIEAGESLTGLYLSGRAGTARRTQRRKPKGWLRSPKLTLHNLQAVKAQVPRGCLTAVTGVSGSGKTSLILGGFGPWLKTQAAGPKLVTVDQRPIGTTPRSTPASYMDILGPVRKLFAGTPEARARGYAPGRFTYNGKGGWCPACTGRGATLVEMHFLSDIWVSCELCQGSRYNESTLQVTWKGHSIADVLQMTVEEARGQFLHQRGIARRLQALDDVGLGYLRLGQPAPTLSGGEAQRLKLAKELISRAKETCYLLDEPTTGLHMADVEHLVAVMHRLVEAGHMVVVIEHNLDVITQADHVIELGPEGGAAGGEIVVAGSPEAVAQHPMSWTGAALRSHGCGPTPGPGLTRS
jgi:excinuclease ABC subunit A